MTVSSALNRKSYAGDGATTVFSTSPVVFFDASDLEVYSVDDTTGATQLLTITTHYAVSGGDGAVGTVTTTFTPASGKTILILRVLPITQESDFVNNDPSDAEVAEDALDKLTMIGQQLDESIGRALLLNVASGLTDVEIPDFTGKAGYIMTINDDEDGFELVSAITQVATVSAFITTLLDDTTAAAALTTLGAGTGDSPQFAAVNIGHATDTTVSRVSAGDIAVEGNTVYRAGGTDVPVADGGTGRSSHTAYSVICGGTSTTAAQQSVASVGTAGQVLTSAGAGALPTFADALTLGTEQASTSGTAITFTGIPSSARMIIISLVGVSADGAGDLIVQLGGSGGVETTGYTSQITAIVDAGNPSLLALTSGIGVSINNGAGDKVTAQIILVLEDASTTWTASGSSWQSEGTVYSGIISGSKSTFTILDRVSVTNTAGDTFDAGVINVAYL